MEVSVCDWQWEQQSLIGTGPRCGVRSELRRLIQVIRCNVSSILYSVATAAAPSGRSEVE